MEVNDPDLDAFESATCAQLRARELGKIEAFIPNLQPNAPVPESMGKSTLKNAPQEPQCCASSHEQSGLDKSPELVWKILKNTQNGFFKGIFSSVLTDGAQMKLMKQKFSQWWNCNVYRKFLSPSSTWQFFIIQWQNSTEMF